MDGALPLALTIAACVAVGGLAGTSAFLFYFSYLFPRDENGRYSLRSRLRITWKFFFIMTGLHRPGRSHKGVIALYDTWGQHLLTEKTLFMNYGYWREATTLDEACTSLARLLADRAGFGPEDAILDVGFGFADQDILWAQDGCAKRIVGINVSPAQVRTARRRVAESGLQSVVSLMRGSATEIPFADGTFDKVVALECAFHFVTRDDFFREAFRVLKPGGRIVTSDVLAPLDCRWRDRLLMWYGHGQWQTPKQNLYDRREYARRLAQAGFRDARVDSIQEFVWEPLTRYMKQQMASSASHDKVHPLHRNRISRSMYVSSTCWLWPLLKMDYVVAVARKPA